MSSHPDRIPLDPSLYSPTAEEVAFFQKLTGINDETDLKNHILAVQAKAYEVRMVYLHAFVTEAENCVRSMDTLASESLRFLRCKLK